MFLAALLACYYAVGRFAKRGQWVVLLVGSLGFYLATGWQNMLTSICLRTLKASHASMRAARLAL